MEPVNETLTHVFVDVRVMCDVVLPGCELRCIRKFAIQKQVRDFEVRAFFGELLDWVAAVAEDSLVTIEIGDGTLAGCCLHIGRVVDVQRRI